MVTISAKQIEALYDLIMDDRHGWYQQLRHSLDWLAQDGLADLPPTTLAIIAVGIWSKDRGMQEHPDAVLIHDPLTEAPMQDAEYPEIRKFVRGEVDSPCNCTPVLAPHVYRLRDGTEVTVTGMYCKAGPQTWSGDHKVCVLRRMWTANPPAMRWRSLRLQEHRVETLQPYPHSSVSTERQAKCIADLPRLVEDISARKHQGWVLLGPTGCSKSTYVASVLYEVETSDFGGMAVCGLPQRSFIHRVRVGDWLQEMHEWQTRSFGSTVKKPSVTPEKITKSLMKEGFTPVLWLEELDKVAMTPARANNLFRLVDAVYELEGTIIVTANATMDEIRSMFDPALVRRLFGEGDDPKNFTLWNLHASAKKTPATKP